MTLASPQGAHYTAVYRLKFPCTNNMTEYEALILGLRFMLSHGVKNIQVYGDSELVVNQVKSKFLCKILSMLKYKHRVWDLTESFDAFNLVPIPRE